MAKISESDVINIAKEMEHEFYTPEHFLYLSADDRDFAEVFNALGGDISSLKRDLKEYLDEIDTIPDTDDIMPSSSYTEMMAKATFQATMSNADGVKYSHILYVILQDQDSFGRYCISKQVDPDKFFTVFNRKMQTVKRRIILPPLGGNIIHETDTDEDDWRKYARNLNEERESQKSDGTWTPIIGRESEIAEIVKIMCRMKKNNPLCLGEPGVGKTAVAYGIADLINDGKIPNVLKDAKVYSIEVADLVAGTQYRGDFEERMKQILNGLSEEPCAICYLDEIHMMVGAGAGANGAMDVSNILKPYLAEGKIRFIGSTTYSEYKQSIQKNGALSRRFQVVDIPEPDEADTIKILKGIQLTYENYHNVKYKKGAIEEIVALTGKYIGDRCQPDKSIDIMDMAGAQINKENRSNRSITVKMVREIVSKVAKIPPEEVKQTEVDVLRELPDKLKSRVFGQDDAVKNIVRCVRMSRAGLNEENKPVASFLFIGPTGVGKTEIAKALSDTLDMPLLRYDMSEFMEKHSVSKLIGTSAGYVGYDDGARLVDEIRKNPRSVLLLDEIEKAHPAIMNILLQVMDNAELTDSQGVKADFKNVIIIMTSNIGAADITKPSLGFGGSDYNDTAMDDACNEFFTPEFRNRLSAIIKFNAINDEMAILIVDKQLNVLNDKVARKKIRLNFSEEVKKMIVKEGVSIHFGARELQRIIDKRIKEPLVDQILFDLPKKKVIDVDVVDGEVVFS